jgi:hypothetical protein
VRATLSAPHSSRDRGVRRDGRSGDGCSGDFSSHAFNRRDEKDLSGRVKAVLLYLRAGERKHSIAMPSV